MLHQSRHLLQQGVYKLYKLKSVHKHAQVVEQTIFDCSDVSLPWLEKPEEEPEGRWEKHWDPIVNKSSAFIKLKKKIGKWIIVT